MNLSLHQVTSLKFGNIVNMRTESYRMELLVTTAEGNFTIDMYGHNFDDVRPRHIPCEFPAIDRDAHGAGDFMFTDKWPENGEIEHRWRPADTMSIDDEYDDDISLAMKATNHTCDGCGLPEIPADTTDESGNAWHSDCLRNFRNEFDRFINLARNPVSRKLQIIRDET